jgi:SRSO17 transposase
MVTQGGGIASGAGGGWAAGLAALHARIAGRVARPEVRARVRRYLEGLLGRVERKNGWQLAEALGEAGPQGVQRLLNAAAWDAEGVRDDLRAYVVEHLGDAASGVLIVDETSFVKKGAKSCGVGTQYAGAVGGTANAQVGVFLAYASATGTAFVDRALYLPRAWAHDPARRAEAGVPDGVRFATKLTLATRLLARAFAAGVPARWVAGDAAYGRSHAFRRWLEEQGRAYALAVPLTHAVAIEGEGRRQTVAKWAAGLPAAAWRPRSAGAGVQGERVDAWACLPLAEETPPGWRRWLLVRRWAVDPDDVAFYVAFGPEATAEEELVRVCGMRWQVEEGFAQAKGEVGLDHYEVRTWTAWHRFVTLALLAHAYLAVTRLAADRDEAAEKRGAPIPA